MRGVRVVCIMMSPQIAVGGRTRGALSGKTRERASPPTRVISGMPMAHEIWHEIWFRHRPKTFLHG